MDLLGLAWWKAGKRGPKRLFFIPSSSHLGAIIILTQSPSLLCDSSSNSFSSKFRMIVPNSAEPRWSMSVCVCVGMEGDGEWRWRGREGKGGGLSFSF